ncbi:hypothetical protein FKM82_008678 [Ascaphus truei]
MEMELPLCFSSSCSSLWTFSRSLSHRITWLSSSAPSDALVAYSVALSSSCCSVGTYWVLSRSCSTCCFSLAACRLACSSCSWLYHRCAACVCCSRETRCILSAFCSASCTSNFSCANCAFTFCAW